MKHNNFYLCILAVFALAVLSFGGCGGSSSSSDSESNDSVTSSDVIPTPESLDVTPTPESTDVTLPPILEGTFRVSAGRYSDGQGRITGTTPSTFTLTLRKNEGSETFTAALSEEVLCSVSLNDGGTTTVPLRIGGSDYVYAPEDGEDYYVSGSGTHDGIHEDGETWREIGIDDDDEVPDFKQELYNNNDWITVVEVQFEPVN